MHSAENNCRSAKFCLVTAIRSAPTVNVCDGLGLEAFISGLVDLGRALAGSGRVTDSRRVLRDIQIICFRHCH